MAGKLIIDLPKLRGRDVSAVRCSYKHHPGNNGIASLLERVCFVLVCRKCRAAPCVKACPRSALEKVPVADGGESILHRATMLCTGCGTCAAACPFGTIYPELIAFVDDICDVCRGRLARGEKPLCVRSCGNDGLDYGEGIADAGETTEVFSDIVVRVPKGALWEPFLRNSNSVRPGS